MPHPTHPRTTTDGGREPRRWELRYAEQQRLARGRASHERTAARLNEHRKPYVALAARYLRRNGYFADATLKAEDVVQAAILPTCEFMFRKPLHELQAVYKVILFREAINAIRAQEVAGSLDREWDGEERTLADVVADPEGSRGYEAVDDGDAEAGRASAIESLLAPSQRETMYVLAANDRDLHATAAELGTSYTAVTSRLHLMREKLRAQAPELIADLAA